MGEKNLATRQQRSLTLAMQRAELNMEELWLRYFALGGEAGPLEVDAYLHGLSELPALQRDMVAHAVNERIDELTWAHRAAYSRTFRDSQPRNQPLAALVTLLTQTEFSPPDRLPTVAQAAGEALGLRVTMYLVDYEQRSLHPLTVPSPGSTNSDPATGTGGEARGQSRLTFSDPEQGLDVDTTLAGRAFRQVQILPSQKPDGTRLWVPLLDGAERLGVLEVEVDAQDDLYDPGLRTHCRWLAALLGHLVVLLSQHGDALDRVRLRERRTISSELIWSLLPPLTAGVDNFVVAGAVEPRNKVSGSAFDYRLSDTTAGLVIIEAAGDGLQRGLIVTAALAAYRSAHHAGHGLYEQVRLIDETISRQFGDAAHATAVLAELHLATGRLRYINVGGPPPLIMRSGRVVRSLPGGRAPALGLGGGELVVGEESLEPNDWLVLHTDGITSARSPSGTKFGDTGLADFLQREAAAGHPPPETARRLVQAVLNHHHGVLEDDAAVLLARWTATNHGIR
jgi:hypothetical protein